MTAYKNIDEMCFHMRQQGFTEEAIAQRRRDYAACPAFNAHILLRKKLADIIDGKITLVPWPWHFMNRLCPALAPGTVTVICGGPGTAKSFFLIQCINFWSRQGYPVSVLEMEMSKSDHLHRLLAQLSRKSDLLDLEWVAANPQESEKLMTQSSGQVEEVGESIMVPPKQSMTYHDVRDWLYTRAKSGDRVIAVDPVTMARKEGRVWDADFEMIEQTRLIAEEYKCSIIYVTHPAKANGNTKGFTLDTLAGGAAYGRHTDYVIGISASEGKIETLATKDTRQDIKCNRTLHLFKTRNGRGQGMLLGYKFEGDSVSFAEQGVIIKDN